MLIFNKKPTITGVNMKNNNFILLSFLFIQLCSAQSQWELLKQEKKIPNFTSIIVNNKDVFAINYNSIFKIGEDLSWEIKYTTDLSENSYCVAIHDLLYENNKYIAVGDYFCNGGSLFEQSAILLSDSGTNWNIIYPYDVGTLKSIVFGNAKFIAFNKYGFYIYSSDAQNWSNPQTMNSGIQFVFDVIYGNDQCYAIGVKTPSNNESMFFIASSNDNINWSVNQLDSLGAFPKIAYGNNLLVVTNDINQILYTSLDGVNWNKIDTKVDDKLVNVKFLNNTFIAIGNNGSILTSTDGETWTNRNPDIKIPLSNMAYFNNMYFVFTSDGNYLTSKDDNLPIVDNKLKAINSSDIKLKNDFIEIKHPNLKETRTIYIEIFTLNGKCIKRKIIKNNNNTSTGISLDKLSTGFFIIRIKAQNINITSKFCINK